MNVEKQPRKDCVKKGQPEFNKTREPAERIRRERNKALQSATLKDPWSISVCTGDIEIDMSKLYSLMVSDRGWLPHLLNIATITNTVIISQYSRVEWRRVAESLVQRLRITFRDIWSSPSGAQELANSTCSIVCPRMLHQYGPCARFTTLELRLLLFAHFFSSNFSFILILNRTEIQTRNETVLITRKNILFIVQTNSWNKKFLESSSPLSRSVCGLKNLLFEYSLETQENTVKESRTASCVRFFFSSLSCRNCSQRDDDLYPPDWAGSLAKCPNGSCCDELRLVSLIFTFLLLYFFFLPHFIFLLLKTYFSIGSHTFRNDSTIYPKATYKVIFIRFFISIFKLKNCQFSVKRMTKNFLLFYFQRFFKIFFEWTIDSILTLKFWNFEKNNFGYSLESSPKKIVQL